MEQLKWRLENGELSPMVPPKVIVLAVGSNSKGMVRGHVHILLQLLSRAFESSKSVCTANASVIASCNVQTKRPCFASYAIMWILLQPH